MDKSDEELLEDICRARAFIQTILPPLDPMDPLKTGFDITFPEPDKAVVIPTVLNQRMPIMSVEYHLCWTKRGLRWTAEGIEVRRALGLPKVARDFYVPDLFEV